VIVLTVDTPFFGRRLTEIRNAFRLPPQLRMANFDASMGVKTGSEYRTNEIHGKAAGVSQTKSQPSGLANKLGTWAIIRENIDQFIPSLSIQI
jgi:isopentenyl diphosphate isomerase/L-lactate dehydrogenase-like FMN-dependent dehydrogenase